jgi:hypothetical protein
MTLLPWMAQDLIIDRRISMEYNDPFACFPPIPVPDGF